MADASIQTELAVKTDLDPTNGNDQKTANSLEYRESPSKQKHLKRRNSKRASGDWSNIKKTHSSLFQHDWNVDNIDPNEQLKVTQDLLVEANEIIMIMAEENEKVSLFYFSC